jgi:hypothetical protein
VPFSMIPGKDVWFAMKIFSKLKVKASTQFDAIHSSFCGGFIDSLERFLKVVFLRLESQACPLVPTFPSQMLAVGTVHS